MIDLTQSHDVLGAYHNIGFNGVRKEFTDPATKYALDVMDEKVQAGYLMKLACFRHLRDLQRYQGGSLNFYYDVNEVDKILKFAAIAPNVDTGEPTKLMPWQKFIFAMLFGWRDYDTNTKRFTRVVLSVARGQGKSYLMAIYMAYSFLIESMGLSNQDFLVTAENYDQTGKLYGYIANMLKSIIDQQPVFKKLAEEDDLVIHEHTGISMRKFNNNLRPLSFNAGKYDSYHFTTAVFDEVGNIKSREGTKKIVSGQVKVPNHQYIEISTSYPDPSVPFHEEQKMIQQVMEQDFSREADRTLGLIWAQDSLDETFKEETWIKSNPLLGLPSQHDILLDGLRDKRDADMLAGTVDDQNKNLNLWLQEATNSYLKLSDIERAIIPSFDIRGRDVYIGFDYSMFSDNTAIAFVYPYQDGDGRQKWHIEQHSFIPWEKAGSIQAKEKQDGIDYRELAKKGYCTITSHPQGLINDDQVYSWLLNYVEENNLHVIFFGYDAWGATNAIKQMDINTDFPLEAIRQRTSELKDPTKFLQKIFVEGNCSRLDDKIMEKALINAEIYEDKIGIQVDKAKATLKIDVVDAIIDALYQGMYHFEDFGIANDKSQQVDRMTAEQVKKWFESKDSGLLDD